MLDPVSQLGARSVSDYKLRMHSASLCCRPPTRNRESAIPRGAASGSLVGSGGQACRQATGSPRPIGSPLCAESRVRGHEKVPTGGQV
jgi:hypothetical protein